MGMFGGRREQRTDRTDRDPHLRLLTVDDADRLRTATRRVLAELGYEADVFGDHLRTADGCTLGLDGLMRKVNAIDPARWDAMIHGHLSAVLSPEQDPVGEDLSERVRVRLWDATTMEERSRFGYALEWQPGVIEVLVIDHPDKVSLLDGRRVTDLAPLGPWYDRARSNLVRELTENADVHVQVVEHDGLSIYCALSESVYTATGAVVLPDVLQRWRPGIDLAGGVLFSICCRNQLAFVPCSDRDAVMSGLLLLPSFTRVGYVENVGPVSPHVYYWRDGIVRQVSAIAEGKIVVTPTAELEELLAGDR